ncbi:hypothetical protein PTKIN_Ptkin09bG0220600 [Pterospermum kingtungense]
MEANVEADEMVFSEGKEAEVTSDEGGFKAAWYTVTIIKLPNKNNTHGKALVRYKNVFVDDNGTPVAVTENIPLSNIRPLSPQPKFPGDQSFQVKDVVDAFYLAGWWTGSVSKVFDNPKRYIVTFDVEFSSSDLRAHWEWVDGKWVESSKLQAKSLSFKPQNTTAMEANVDAEEMVLNEGKEAEVTSDEKGFNGAWYTVTILKLPNENNNADGNALVQYKNLLEYDNDSSYTESVPLSHIRPLPPHPKVPGDHCFQVKDFVDAFHLNGWWTGCVSKVVDNPKRYIVTFDVVFSSYDLRPHWEWVDGKWVKSSKLQNM